MNTPTMTLFDSDIDFSFAICPRRKQCYQECDDRTASTCSDDDEASSIDSREDSSRRSVSFAENVVSEVISVPRHERNSISALVYNQLDLTRFKQEAKLERIHQVQVIW